MLPFPELQTTAGKDHNSRQKKYSFSICPPRRGYLNPMPDHRETAGPSSFFHQFRQWFVCLSSPSSPLLSLELLLLLLHPATSMRGPTRNSSRFAVRVLQCRSPTCGAQRCRHAGFTGIEINTVVTSGPPVSGQTLDVVVSGYTPYEIVVSRSSRCSKLRWLTQGSGQFCRQDHRQSERCCPVVEYNRQHLRNVGQQFPLCDVRRLRRV